MLQLASSETSYISKFSPHVSTSAMPPTLITQMQLLLPNHQGKTAATFNTVQNGMERVECHTSPCEEERFVTEHF